MPEDGVLRDELRALGRGDDIAAVERLSGGMIADTWLVSYTGGTRVVGKTVTEAPGDLFGAEAGGLAVLGGFLPVPSVLAVTGRLLLLEALSPREDSESAWEAFARAVAGMHRRTVHDRFGWASDGYLGRLRQDNTWSPSGHEFFASRRLLRYLSEPRAEKALTSTDRRKVERLCDRLPEVIPAMPAVLTHGDLWSANLLSRDGDGIVVIDPAVSYTWAEVDLSMLWCCPRPPESQRFFDVYQELNPSPPGWIERMPLLNLREVLSMIAHVPDPAASVQYLRDVLAPF